MLFHYAALNMYRSFKEDCHTTIGILVTTPDCSIVEFFYCGNLNWLSSFEPDLDIAFLRSYLQGIKEDVAIKNADIGSKFSLDIYTQNFRNEFKFSPVKVYYCENIQQIETELMVKYGLATQ